MKRPTFNETVDVLVKAYLNDELKHDDCAKCVVGNLCGGRNEWQYLFITDPRTSEQAARKITPLREMMLGKTSGRILMEAEQICLSTGYSIDELKQIEFAFETASGFMSIKDEDDEIVIDNDEWMFNGLMAVVDVLAEIHNVDLSAKESAKLQFVRS